MKKRILLFLLLLFCSVSLGSDFGDFPVFDMPSGLVAEYKGRPIGHNSDTSKWESAKGNLLEMSGVSTPTINSDGSRTFDGSADYFVQQVCDPNSGTVEDFSTYNETDGPGKVTVTANTITLTDGDRDEDYYATRDLGAGSITDFTYWVDVDVTSVVDNNASRFWPWAISNANDDLDDIDLASGDYLGVFTYATGASTYAIILQSCDGGSLTSVDASGDITVNDPSYLAITRSGTTVTVEIYSTATLRITGGAGDVDTITGTCVGTAFRYVYGIASKNTGDSGKDISGTVSNLTEKTLITDFNITGDLTLCAWVKPDDGQPAADNGIISKYSPTNGFRSYLLNLQTTGKIQLYLSSDGNDNAENETTDAAVFANGPATSFTHVCAVYDAGTSMTIYVNGSAVASTTGVGGVPASIFDSPSKVTIGALSDASSLFDGNIANPMIFNQALSARDIRRLHKRGMK